MSQWAPCKVKYLVATLPYSNMYFAKAYPVERLESLLDGIESAFSYLGGSPEPPPTTAAGRRFEGLSPDTSCRPTLMRGWVRYNEQRTHQGKMCCGRTPWETFEDGRRLAKEKAIDNAA